MQGLNFKQEIELKNTGVTVKHWRLTEVQINYEGDFAKLTFVGFKSKQDREGGKSRPSDAVLYFTIADTDEVKSFKDFMRAESNNRGLKNHLKKAVKDYLITAEESGVFANSPED